MSAVIDVNQAQIDAVVNEFDKLKTNITSKIAPATQKFMGEVQDVAIDLTHFISHNLQSGWGVQSSGVGQTISVKLVNVVEYAEEEFSRPGIREDVGTPHDVRPAIQDKASAGIEGVVFNAVIDGLRR